METSWKDIIKDVLDDKGLAMICIAILGGLGMFFMKDNPGTVITGAITALGALATGKLKP